MPLRFDDGEIDEHFPRKCYQIEKKSIVYKSTKDPNSDWANCITELELQPNSWVCSDFTGLHTDKAFVLNIKCMERNGKKKSVENRKETFSLVDPSFKYKKNEFVTPANLGDVKFPYLPNCSKVGIYFRRTIQETLDWSGKEPLVEAYKKSKKS